MVPSDLRLLTGINDTLRALSGENLTASAQARLASAHIGINELALRTQRTFFDDHRREGTELAREGRRFVGGGLSSLTEAASVAEIGLELTDLVRQLSERDRTDTEVRRYLARVVDWENDLYKVRASSATAIQETASSPVKPVDCDSLRRYLTTRFPEWGLLTVTNVHVVAGGFSKKTVLFDVDDSLHGPRSLVMRAEQPDALVFFEGAQIANEFRVLEYAWRTGLRVAEPLWHESDSTWFGGSFLVSRKAPGKNIGSAVGAADAVSSLLMQDLVENLVRIHDTRVDPADDSVRLSHLGRWAALTTLEASTRANVAYWESEVRKMDLPPSPLAIRSLEWLARNVPRCDEPPCLVHRDFGLHNVLVLDDRVTCILDWESATVGDPAEELSWFMNALPGTFDRQYILDLYEKLSGRRIAESRIRYFDVFNSLKYSVICSLALSIFERNREASMDLCRLGLVYMHHGTSKLNDCIEKADAEP